MFHIQTLGKKYFYQKRKNLNFFHLGPGRPGASPRPASRPTFSLFQAGLEYWKIRSRLLVKCKKLLFRNFETVFYKSGLTKFEIKFLKYRIIKRKVIWVRIRFGFQTSNFWKAGPRPAWGWPQAGLLSVWAETWIFTKSQIIQKTYAGRLKCYSNIKTFYAKLLQIWSYKFSHATENSNSELISKLGTRRKFFWSME